MKWDELKHFLQKWQTVVDQHFPELVLRPGTRFQPVSWRVPSYPERDFYFHIGSVIVSPRVKELFDNHPFRGWQFSEVELKQAGAFKDSEIELEYEFDMEDEIVTAADFLEAAPMLKDPSEAGPFYNAVDLFDWHRELRASEMSVLWACEDCGYVRYDSDPAQEELDEYCEENRIIPRRFIPDYDIFSTPFGGIGRVIRPELFDMIQSTCDLSYYDVIELTIVDDL